MEKYNNVSLPRRKIFVNNFIGGIAWAIGTLVGLTIIIIIVGSILSKVNLIPIVGDFVSQVAQQVVKNNPNLVK